MQTETYIIIGGLLAGWAFTAFYFLKALKRAHINGISEGLVERNELHNQRVQVLNRDLSHLSRVRESELKQHTANLFETKAELTTLREQALTIKATPFTASDYRTLTEIAQALQLAHDTWKAMPGTETTQAKAVALAKQAQALAYRTFSTVTAGTSLNGEPLDTQLIDWLNKRGDLWGELEQSTISFPHLAITTGYNHLRDALREAFEQDQIREGQDLDLDQVEAAA